MFEFIKVNTATDIETVSRLAHETWNAHYLPIIGQQQIDYMLKNFQSIAAIKQQLSENYLYFLVKIRHQSVAYFAIVPDDQNNTVHISKLYVIPALQRTGAGCSILSYTEACYANTQFNQLWLTVNRDNRQAIRFYQKNGFKKTGCIIQAIGNGFVMDDYKMVKRM